MMCLVVHAPGSLKLIQMISLQKKADYQIYAVVCCTCVGRAMVKRAQGRHKKEQMYSQIRCFGKPVICEAAKLDVSVF